MLQNPFDMVMDTEKVASYEELICLATNWWKQQIVSRYPNYRKELALYNLNPGEMVLLPQAGQKVPRIEIVKMRLAELREAREALKALEELKGVDDLDRHFMQDDIPEPDENLLGKKPTLSPVQKKK